MIHVIKIKLNNKRNNKKEGYREGNPEDGSLLIFWATGVPPTTTFAYRHHNFGSSSVLFVCMSGQPSG